MTCREKWLRDYPDADPGTIENSALCVHAEGIMHIPSWECGSKGGCDKCWDQEIPEEDTTDPVTIQKETGEYVDPIYISIHTNSINDPAEVIADVFKYAYTIKDRTVNISIM